MRKVFVYFILGLTLISCNTNNVKLTFIETTDVHGRFFNYDFSTDSSTQGSMAQFATYLKSKNINKDKLILIDNGDIVQGTPIVWYSNFKDTINKNISAQVLNYFNYDVAILGNHDVEAGVAVYNKLKKQYTFPLLAANMVSEKTNNPVFKPYTILNKSGIKIAVLGLITPGIPNWLPHNLYKGYYFQGMVSSAKYWMTKIKKLNPDIIVGSFHSGLNSSYGGYNSNDTLNPNAVLEVAKQVPGFDIIFAGHDHKQKIITVKNSAGDSVVVIDGGSHAKTIGYATLEWNKKQHKIVKLTKSIDDITKLNQDKEYLKRFTPYLDSVKQFFSSNVGYLAEPLCPNKALFGPSKFMSFIHTVQLNATHADISLAAPLQIHNCINKGQLNRSDVFALYKYENYLATLDMTISEVDQFLEYSVSEWFNIMSSSDDNLLKYNDKHKLANPYFNFSSASGISYIVDVSKHDGDKVKITKVKNSVKFSSTDTMRIVISSYRLVGGGGIMPLGAGISRKQLKNRHVKLSSKPIKSILEKYLRSKKTTNVKLINNWKIIPEKWAEKAIKREIIAFK